jgi:hypothetical protein
MSTKERDGISIEWRARRNFRLPKNQPAFCKIKCSAVKLQVYQEWLERSRGTSTLFLQIVGRSKFFNLEIFLQNFLRKEKKTSGSFK